MRLSSEQKYLSVIVTGVTTEHLSQDVQVFPTFSQEYFRLKRKNSTKEAKIAGLSTEFRVIELK